MLEDEFVVTIVSEEALESTPPVNVEIDDGHFNSTELLTASTEPGAPGAPPSFMSPRDVDKRAIPLLFGHAKGAENHVRIKLFLHPFLSLL